MRRQLDETIKDAYDPETDFQQPLEKPDTPNAAQRLWSGWVWLTGPKSARFGNDLASQEALRRARLISALLVIVLASICFLIPSGLGGYSLVWIQILTMASCGVLVAALNRWGRVTLSALVMTLLVDITLAQFILSLPNLNTTNLADFDLFTIAILTGGILLPRWLILSTSALQISLIILLFYLMPHDPVLDAEIGKYEAGLGYAALTDSILLQICATSIALLYAWSVERALQRANRAEELAEARIRISEQAHQIAQQNDRLAHGIALLQEAQARVANGDYNARISLEKNELLPVAVSFNLMVERLGRNAQMQQSFRRLEQAVGHLLAAFMAVAQHMAAVTYSPTGTVIDQAYPYLVRFRALTLALAQSMPLAEGVHLALQRQQNTLAQIESNLTNTLLLTQELAGVVAVAEAAYSTMLPQSLEGSRSAEQAPDMPRLRVLLERQAVLLEQTQQQCAHLAHVSGRGFHHARALTQKLREAV